MGNAWGAVPHKKWPFDSDNCRVEWKLRQRECTCRRYLENPKKKKEKKVCDAMYI